MQDRTPRGTFRRPNLVFVGNGSYVLTSRYSSGIEAFRVVRFWLVATRARSQVRLSAGWQPRACGSFTAVIRHIAPQLLMTDLPSTRRYYKTKLGFDCAGTRQDPSVYAIVARSAQNSFPLRRNGCPESG